MTPLEIQLKGIKDKKCINYILQIYFILVKMNLIRLPGIFTGYYILGVNQQYL